MEQTMIRLSTLCICMALLTGVLPIAVQAQTYPARTVRVVVAYPPGGPTDLIARQVNQKLGETMGQQFIVDNRGGSNGIIGTDMVARSQPDGYTLLFGTSSLASNGSLYPSLPYDAAKDLSPISLTANTPYFLVLNAAVAAASVKELVALAKTKPGELTYASAGNGAGTHLAGEMFNIYAGVKMLHVPYKGTGPAVTDLVAGRIQMMFVGLPAVIQHVKSGKLRLVGVAEPKRSPLMPDSPTVAEAGVPGFESSAWFGYFGPGAMPRELRVRLASEMTRLMQGADLQNRILGLGAVPLWTTPDQFADYFREESIRYARIIKEAGIKLD
jgi:tripartite-type tricarboxylate transporter receptor subunit TctC